MAVKTYGKIVYQNNKKGWHIAEAEPHVWIRLKSIFPRIELSSKSCYLADTPAMASDLEWFTMRYPLLILPEHLKHLKKQAAKFRKDVNLAESILLPDYTPGEVLLNPGKEARHYQMVFCDLLRLEKRILLGDDIGLGKTLSAILPCLTPGTLPAAVVCQAHLPRQWKKEIEKYTNLKVHIIQKNDAYSLTGENQADVYIFKYTSLSGWSGVFKKGLFKYCIFDEVQELRTGSVSKKYQAADALAGNAKYCSALSATPIYNYGDEMYNIMQIVRPDILGERKEFLREWCIPIGSGKHKVKDPKALGSYLMEQRVLVRRTRKEVNRELPPLNKIVHEVPYDEHEAEKSEKLAKDLAIRVLTGQSFMERGEAALEFDVLMRQTTGIAKAKGVAAYVRMFLDKDDPEPIVLAGWHREVYRIWAEELKEFNPVFYTGKETTKQKDAAIDAFISGKTNLFIISVRSGIGLDGLQHHCHTVIHGELDWSPQVHEQLTGRVHRDGNEDNKTSIYLTCDNGSDPVIMGILGLKASQSYHIMNPTVNEPQTTKLDVSHVKELAKAYLDRKNIKIPDQAPENVL